MLEHVIRLGAQLAPVALALHVLCGVGWMGLDLGLGVLVVAGATSDSGPTVAAVYTVARLVIPIVVPVLATGMLVTGCCSGSARSTAWCSGPGC